MSGNIKIHRNRITFQGKERQFQKDYLETDYRFNRDGTSHRWLTAGMLANANAFFMNMCDKLSKGEILDLSMDITKRVYGIYPNVDAIKAMANKYGYDKEVKEMNIK